MWLLKDCVMWAKMVAGALYNMDSDFLLKLLRRPTRVIRIFGVAFLPAIHNDPTVSFAERMRRRSDTTCKLWEGTSDGRKIDWSRTYNSFMFCDYLRHLPPKVLDLFNNKNLFNQMAAKLGLPMPTPLAVHSLSALPLGVDGIIVKPNDGMFGMNVQLYKWRLDGRTLFNALTNENVLHPAKLLAELVALGDSVVVEERLVNHASISSIVGADCNALCTFRVTTVADIDLQNIHCLVCILRLCVRSDTAADNGAIFIDCDHRNGKLRGSAYDVLGHAHVAHPLTGTPLDGHEIAELPRVVQTACEWHERVALEIFSAPLRVFAWDVALTKSGVKIIEVNEIGAQVFQLASGPWLADATFSDIVRNAGGDDWAYQIFM